MNVIIYGSYGFVGRYIVRNLYNKVNLILPARNIKKIQEVFKDLSLINYVQINENDIQEPIYKFNPDIVINLIGILTETSNQTFEKVHFEITKNLVDASKAVGVKKFIQMSALGADVNSKSRYLKTKAMAEEYIIKSGLNYVIFRPSIIIGREQKLFEDFRFYSKITPIFMAPYDAKVQPVSVLDVADCFEKATISDIKNEIFELCGNEVIDYVELFKFALDFTGVKRVVMPVPKKTFKLLLPVFSLMPKPIMTLDQYYMLEKDNVCSGRYKGVKDLLGFVRDWRKDF